MIDENRSQAFTRDSYLRQVVRPLLILALCALPLFAENPTLAERYVEAGIASMTEGRVTRAIDYFELALSYTPRGSDARFHVEDLLATAYTDKGTRAFHQGNLSLARTLLSHALTLRANTNTARLVQEIDARMTNAAAPHSAEAGGTNEHEVLRDTMRTLMQRSIAENRLVIQGIIEEVARTSQEKDALLDEYTRSRTALVSDKEERDASLAQMIAKRESVRVTYRDMVERGRRAEDLRFTSLVVIGAALFLFILVLIVRSIFARRRVREETAREEAEEKAPVHALDEHLLPEALRTDDARMRADAVESVAEDAYEMFEREGGISSEQEGALRAMLTDANSRVRANAALALSSYDEEYALSVLEEMLHSDDMRMRVSAIWALGQVGDELAISLLVRADAFDHVEEKRVMVKAVSRFVLRYNEGEVPVSDMTTLEAARDLLDTLTCALQSTDRDEQVD